MPSTVPLTFELGRDTVAVTPYLSSVVVSVNGDATLTLSYEELIDRLTDAEGSWGVLVNGELRELYRRRVIALDRANEYRGLGEAVSIVRVPDAVIGME